jgi:hypothetical protein
MARSEDWFLRHRAASSYHNSPETIERLSKDEHPFIRARIALNFTTPLYILGVLATDKNPYVRHAVARNPRVTNLLIRIVAMTDAKEEKARIEEDALSYAQEFMVEYEEDLRELADS